jgi:hypothetical protein
MKQKILTALIILLFIHIALSAELTEAPFLNTKNQQNVTSTYKSTTSGHTDDYAVEKTQQNIEIKPGSSLNVKNKRGNIRIIRWDNDYIDISATKTSRQGKKALQYIDIIINNQNGLNIETKYNAKNLSASVDYLIKVPGNIQIGNVTTQKGRVIVK